jgi:hypothetical protein
VRAAARCVAVASLAGAGDAAFAVADGALVLSLHHLQHPSSRAGLDARIGVAANPVRGDLNRLHPNPEKGEP